jgi:hypothetical protein
LWVTPDEVLARPGLEKVDPTLVASCVGPASEILYALSGRQWTGGGCQATVRPTAIRSGWNRERWGAFTGFGFWPSWGICSGESFGGYWSPLAHEGCDRHDLIDLGAYPVTDVLSVKIDGALLDATGYELVHQRQLRRLRALATDEHVRWPTCQDLQLPDTQPGTFSVTYLYGSQPPDGGAWAAAVLAAEFAKAAQPGMTSRLPGRTTQVSRQGITATTEDPMTMIAQGYTGIPEVDLWARSVNPQKMQRRSRVWSPDMGRANRAPR